jgi:hypothetical protein
MELVDSRVAGGFYFRRRSLSIEAVASVLPTSWTFAQLLASPQAAKWTHG